MVHHDSDTLTNKGIATKVNVVYYNAINNKLPKINAAIYMYIKFNNKIILCKDSNKK